jgi:hypothetical protein
MYAINGHTENLSDIILDIASAKRIVVKDDGLILTASKINYNRERILCGAVYIVSKSCKPKDEISISGNDESDVVISVSNKDRMLPSDIENAFRQDIEEDSVNVFAIYLKHLAASDGLSIEVDPTDECPIRIRVWKK